MLSKNKLIALEQKVFIYPSSRDYDKYYFKHAIAKFLAGTDTDFRQAMFKAVWDRNNNGQTLKYCYFNDRVQKVFLTSDFIFWCENILEKMTEEFKLKMQMEKNI